MAPKDRAIGLSQRDTGDMRLFPPKRVILEGMTPTASLLKAKMALKPMEEKRILLSFPFPSPVFMVS